jgi:hypothetical protein
MFWNENPYGYTYREIPNQTIPFFGQTPKLPTMGTNPWFAPQIPPVFPFAYNYNPIFPTYGLPFTTPFASTLPFSPFQQPFQQVPVQNLPFQAYQGMTPTQGFNPYPWSHLPYRPF